MAASILYATEADPLFPLLGGFNSRRKNKDGRRAVLLYVRVTHTYQCIEIHPAERKYTKQKPDARKEN